MKARASSLNLTAVLVLAGFAELVLHRTTARLFLPTPFGGPAWSMGFDRAAAFAFHFAGILAWVVVAATLVGTLTRGEFFPRGMRVSVSFVSLGFLLLAAVGVLLVPLSPRSFVYARTCHAFVVLFTWMATLRSGAPGRLKLGFAVLALPVFAAELAVFGDAAGWLAGRGGELSHASEVGAMLAGVMAPVLLVWQRPRARPATAAAVVAGVAAAAGLAALLATRLDLVQAAALYGWRLDVPAGTARGAGMYWILLVLAAGGATTASLWNLWQPGPGRLLGLGLLLVFVGGYQATNPHQLLLSLAGFLACGAAAARIGTAAAATPMAHPAQQAS